MTGRKSEAVMDSTEALFIHLHRSLDPEAQCRLRAEVMDLLTAPTCPPPDEVQRRAAAFWGWVDSRRA